MPPLPNNFKIAKFRCLLSDCKFHLLFPKGQVLDSSKLKDLADNNFKFDKNGAKYSKTVENTMGEGDMTHD